MAVATKVSHGAAVALPSSELVAARGASATVSPLGLHAEDELVLAVQAGQYDKAHRLLLCGANPSNRTHDYTNALREACRRGDAEMYAILLPHLRQWLRVRTEHPWFAFRLKGLDVAEPRGTPLELAVSAGALRLIPALAAENAEIDEHYSKLMINRIAGRHVRAADAVVAMLQEAGGQVLGIALLACLRLAPAAAVQMAALLLDAHRLDPNATIDDRDIAHFDEYFGEPALPTPPTPQAVHSHAGGAFTAVGGASSSVTTAAALQLPVAPGSDHERRQHVLHAHAGTLPLPPLCSSHGPGRNVPYFPGPVLLAAAVAGNAAVCQLLLSRGADSSAVAANGCGLFGAAAAGLRAVVEASTDENDARERLAKGHRDYPAVMRMALRAAAMRRRRHALAACWKARQPFPMAGVTSAAAVGGSVSAAVIGNDNDWAAAAPSLWPTTTASAAGAASGEYAAALSAVAGLQTIAVGGAGDTSVELAERSRAPGAPMAFAVRTGRSCALICGARSSPRCRNSCSSLPFDALQDIIVAPVTPAYPALRLTIKSAETAAQVRRGKACCSVCAHPLRVRHTHSCHLPSRAPAAARARP